MRNNKLLRICLFFTTVLLMSLTLSFSIYATSGCCSGHGGVKCSAGPDSDGSVICNDGWKDSDCAYSSMEKCKISPNNDSSSHNNSSGNNSSSSNSNSNHLTISPSTNSNASNSTTRSFMSRHPFLGFLLGINIALPVIPLGLLGMIMDRFSSKKPVSSQNEINRNRSEYKKPYSYQGNMICPRCGGRLVKKNGRYGYFYGCENYRINGCKYTRNI